MRTADRMQSAANVDVKPVVGSARLAGLACSIAAALLALASAACQGIEGPTMRGDAEPTTASKPTSFWRDAVRSQSIEPRVYDNDVPRRLQWIVDTGVAPGGLSAVGATLPGGLGVDVRSEAPPGRRDAVSVEDGTPAALRVGQITWTRVPDDPTGIASGTTVTVEWVVCLRERGTCAVDVDAVPRVSPCGAASGAPATLEAWRVRRTVPLGSALVIGTASGRPQNSVAAALVGADSARPARFVIHVKE